MPSCCCCTSFDSVKVVLESISDSIGVFFGVPCAFVSGKDRDLTVSEFQCGMCLRFYHEACVGCLEG